ncbi:Protein-only RNase P [Trypanosoma melophagium]|uniref:Protein-only RNase P n=1 Tax=Trypanosoma melophagium TaxID=715481 RepID=UPI00351A1520|nr:Protein-only RNase P [Trypanosoma melophagium]
MRRISTAVGLQWISVGHSLCSFQTRWKSCSPAEELQRRVGQLVSTRNVDQVAHEIRDALSKSIFSMKAFASALFLCEQTHNEIAGMELVRLVQASNLVESWDDESVLSVVLRLQCAVGDAAAATQMFSFLVSKKLLRLRSTSVFLNFWCKRLDRSMAFAVYAEALRQGIELRAEDYVELGRLCVALQEPISTLHHILREMQEHVLCVPPEMLSDVLSPWAQRAGLRVETVLFPNSDSTQQPGSCSCCHTVLKGHRFTTAQKTRLLKDVVEVALVAQRKKSVRVRIGFETWRRFVALHGQNIDVLIDGANLGYYGLSSWYSDAKRALLLKLGKREEDIKPQDIIWSKRGSVDVGVNFHLIDLAVQEARRRGMRPLIILHERHCETKNMTNSDEVLASQWRRDGILYCTPSGLNDDLCWLYAALELTTPTDAVVGTVEKTVWVLTNDLMRDHHFKLLSPRFFARWRDRHRISFKCSRKDNRTLLHWELPAPYAQCIQEVEPLKWHIPIAAEKEEGEEENNDDEKKVVDENCNLQENGEGNNNINNGMTVVSSQVSHTWACIG